MYVCECVLKSNKYLQILSLARTDYLGINCNLFVSFMCVCENLNAIKKGSAKIYVYSKKKPYDYAPVLFCRIYLWFKTCFVVVVYTFVACLYACHLSWFLRCLSNKIAGDKISRYKNEQNNNRKTYQLWRTKWSLLELVCVYVICVCLCNLTNTSTLATAVLTWVCYSYKRIETFDSLPAFFTVDVLLGGVLRI